MKVAQINLGTIAVDVILKDIKNVHLSVHPPTGRVRISAPARMGVDTIRLFAIAKLDWSGLKLLASPDHPQSPIEKANRSDVQQGVQLNISTAQQ